MSKDLVHRHLFVPLGLAACLVLSACSGPAEAPAPSAGANEQPAPPAGANEKPSAVGATKGWLGWRGPGQMGVTEENIGWQKGAAPLWTYDISGGGTPVVADDTVYLFGYYGAGPELQEALLALDADTGQKRWEHRFSDYLSDIIYNRYAIGAPAVDAETGNVYIQSTAGILKGFSPGGELLWEHSMMEEYGRLTFPNGRTGAPVVFEGLVIVHGITANWGANGPARNRFYAFDKRTGDLVWYSTPGTGPIDSSFSTPIIGRLGDRAVLYAGTGCGHVVAVDARTGQPLWRMQISNGGVNSSLLLYDGPLPGDQAKNESYNPATDTDADNTVPSLVVIHGKENLDSTLIGRMVRIKLPTAEMIAGASELPLVLDKSAEIWRNDDAMRSFTSSPILVGDRVYTTVATGEFVATDAVGGETLWRLKLGNDQLHASPAYAKGSGLFFVPMHESRMFVVRDENTEGKIIDEVELEGVSLGGPAFWAGRVYLETKKKVYAWGPKEAAPVDAEIVSQSSQNPAEITTRLFATEGKATSARVVPPEFILPQGGEQAFRVELLDANGAVLEDDAQVTGWEKYIPPTARVKAKLDATFVDGKNAMAATPDAPQSAGAIKATTDMDSLTATARGRVMVEPPYKEDFNAYELNQTSPATSVHGPEKFAFPPLPWTGARVKFRVIDLEGEKVLGNVLDVLLFQRARSFIGGDAKDYTLQADIRTDGNRRISSEAGLINQRYQICLVGNKRMIEISSNYDRLFHQTPFPFKPNAWYTLKTSVESKPDGSGVIRVKAWERDADEPADWTVELDVPLVHDHGAPGIYAFSPQAQKRVYFDNIKLEKN
ncbi:MAG: PQQ-binding-like beta-propeller repeat protein [Verrucomicrobiota bacterium]